MAHLHSRWQCGNIEWSAAPTGLPCSVVLINTGGNGKLVRSGDLFSGATEWIMPKSQNKLKSR